MCGNRYYADDFMHKTSACKAVYAGSIPTSASITSTCQHRLQPYLIRNAQF